MTARERMIFESGRLKGQAQAKMLCAHCSSSDDLRAHFVKWARDYHHQYVAVLRRIRESYQ